MKQLIGIGSSAGIGIAKAFLLVKPKIELDKPEYTIDAKKAKETLNNAIELTRMQLAFIKSAAIKKIGEANAEVFEAHIQIANDPTIVSQINDAIDSNKSINLVKTVDNIFNNFRDMFAQMEDAYFRERAVDIVDVKDRLLANIIGLELPDLLSIKQECIIVAHDLTPSQTALLNKKFIKGIINEIGGRTSHTAIMARSLEIPAVLGAKNVLSMIEKDQLVALDGKNGLVDLEPSQKEWEEKEAEYVKYQKELQTYITKESITLDGRKVLIEANIGNPKDAKAAVKWGCDGVGLYRTEFLYMDSTEWPSEEVQFEGYKEVLQAMPDKMVVIRTLDIGGDKKLSYFEFEHEDNPFLGNRAIRFCLQRKDIFKTQLRALARASIYGKLGIMFPMISTIKEFKDAKKLFLECVEEVKKEGRKVADNIQLGMMTEIPAAAILTDQFAKYVDFCSIGTNDLNQYTFACDRQNKNISYLYQPNCPSLLRLINSTISGCHSQKRWAGMCGEMAGDILSIPLLIGLGLDAFSMSASSIPAARKIINNINYKECQELAKQALELETIDQVNELVKKFLDKNNIKN